MIFLGIDNGVSGSVGIIGATAEYVKTPVIRVLNYTKTKQWLHRVDAKKLHNLLNIKFENDVLCLIERPMINPGRWRSTMSAMRAMEATLIVLDMLRIPYLFIDSKEWQKKLLPKGLEKGELKEASLQVGKRLFPKINFKGHTDADGLLIAEYARRTYK